MSTGCQKVSQTDSAPGRQSDRMTVWQNSRAAKEPALVSKGVIFIPRPLPPCDFAIDVVSLMGQRTEGLSGAVLVK